MSIALALLIIGLVIVALYFRNEIANIIAGSAYLAAGTFRTVWPAIMWTVIIAAAIGLGGWVVLIVIMVGLGVYAHSLISAIIISIFFPVWFFAAILPNSSMRIWIVGRMVCWVRIVLTPILAIAAIFLFIGIWSPAISQSIDRWSGNKKQAVANSFDKDSLQSEAEAGIFGFLPEETWVYNQYGQPYRKLPQGSLVRAMDLKGVPVQPDSEGLLQVMLPNETGDFVKGNTGYVPSRKIDWDWKGAKKAEAARKVAEKAAADQKEAALQQEKEAKLPYEKVVSVKYSWDDSWPGLDTVPAGKYEVTVVKSDFVYKWTESGEKREIRIGPEGTKRKLSSQEDLPLPNAPFGALIVKYGDDPWQLVGNKTLTTEVSRMSYARVTRNVPSVAASYNDSGGDTIKIKRSGQLSAASFFIFDIMPIYEFYANLRITNEI